MMGKWHSGSSVRCCMSSDSVHCLALQCSDAGKCTSRCSSDAACRLTNSSTPFCDQKTQGACVACMYDADCKSPTPSCSAASATCVAACTSNANCQAAAPVCSASLGKCVPSPCQICQGCVSSAHDYVASQARAQDSAAVALAFYTWCTSNPALELTACAKTMAAVAASPRGNLGERAHEPSVQLCLCLVCLPILVRHFWRIASQCYCTPLQASEPVPCACGLANARRPLLATLAARWTPPASAAAQPLSGASLTSAAWRGLQWRTLRLCPASPSVARWQQGAASPLRTAAVLTSCE